MQNLLTTYDNLSPARWWKISNVQSCRHLERIFLVLLSFTQFFVLQSVSAATLTVPGIDDAELNSKLTNLTQSNASIPEQQVVMTGVINGLLTALAPQIKALSGYDNPFLANCTVFFNSQIEKVTCDLNFDPPEELLEHADPEQEVIKANIYELPKTNILVTRAFVDWSAGTYLYSRGKICLQQPLKCIVDAKETPSNTADNTCSDSVSKTSSTSASSSDTTTADGTESKSASETESALITLSESLDVSQTLSPVQSKMPIANWSAASGIYEDATNQTGRYKVEDSVVTDTFSGLQWEQQASTKILWSSANSYCLNRTVGAFSDWRLPTVMELQSLVDYTINYQGTTAAINTLFFPNTPTDKFWSQTQMAGGTPIQSWFVSFGNTGYAGVHSSKWDNYGSDNYYVRCVRGGNSTITNRFDKSISGVVKDKLTGLWWEDTNIGESAWHNLQSYCSDRNTGNITKWRPLTVKELLTIVDYTKLQGRMMDAVFSGAASWCWSSSAVSGYSGAWFVRLDYGRVSGYGITKRGCVRCVR